MLQVRHLLEGKGRAIYTIGADEPVLAAIHMMADRYIGALVVMRGDALVGMVSERDYARKIILKGHSSRDTPVHDIMASPVLTVAPEDTVETCMRLCTDNRVRHLPVVESGKLVGILTASDFIRLSLDLMDALEASEKLECEAPEE